MLFQSVLYPFPIQLLFIENFAKKKGINKNQNQIERKAEKEIKKEQSCSFMQFGMMSRNHDEFKKKYGVSVNYQNCVISPFISKEAKENNTLVANQLTEKYGDVWKKDLGFIPYGL